MDLSPVCRMVWMIASGESEALSREYIETEALFLGICKLGDVPLADWLARMELPPEELEPARAEVAGVDGLFRHHGLDPVAFRRTLRGLLAGGNAPAPVQGKRVMHRSPRCRSVFEAAGRLARQEGRIKLLHLLLAILQDRGNAACSLMREVGISVDQLQSSAAEQLGQPAAAGGHTAPPSPSPEKTAPRKPTPWLDQFGRDITRLAREGKLPPLIGRKEEMTRIAQVLCRQRKNNPILVGEPGVGKTCIVEGLAQRLLQPGAPAGLAGKRIVELSMSALVAGSQLHGQFEERLQNVLEEARSSPEIVIFIDEIHTMVGAGSAGRGAMDAANILKPALARGEIRCIGATTTAEYRRYIEKDEALARRFEMVWVEEPSRDEAVAIVQGLRASLEAHHGVSITDAAIAASVDLAIRYLPDQRLPDKCLDLIDQACAQRRLATLTVVRVPDAGPGESERAVIDAEEVARVISKRCRVPLERMTQGEQERLSHLAEALSRRVIGQDHAVSALAQAVLAARAGLADPRRPQGVFLFLGPTGVGKTELARALAEFLFDDEDRLIRIDMSEYTEKHSIARLIGSPPGYVGYEEEGQLTGKIRSQPYSVVLFDEVEKAHPEVLNLFLQVFDEGRLTDAKGRRADFRNAFIILTSNLGARSAMVRKRQIGFAEPAAAVSDGPDLGEYRDHLLAAARAELAPELFNRIRSVIVFHPITPGNLRRIIDKLLDRVRNRLSEKGLSLEITDGAYEVLMSKGYSEADGVRRLERVIEDLIVAPLAAGLLENRFTPGARVVVKAEGDGLALGGPA
ncbi:MAG TPA: ATP-dependent Clp protease ATP-binding subunit [Symbiobacteriaceae bacterium]|nr:ATP-dependent Clp protease ATP-binding subunit [Symbiobacteriaceae bacterium]